MANVIFTIPRTRDGRWQSKHFSSVLWLMATHLLHGTITCIDRAVSSSAAVSLSIYYTTGFEGKQFNDPLNWRCGSRKGSRTAVYSLESPTGLGPVICSWFLIYHHPSGQRGNRLNCATQWVIVWVNIAKFMQFVWIFNSSVYAPLLRAASRRYSIGDRLYSYIAVCLSVCIRLAHK